MIFPYVFIRRAQAKNHTRTVKRPFNPINFFPSVFHHVKEIWSPTESRRLEGRVVIFCIVKLTSPLSSVALYYMDKTDIFLKITLINCPLLHGPINFSWPGYGVWFVPFFFFFFFWEKGRGYLLMIPWIANIKCQDTGHKLVGLVSEQGCRFVSRAFFLLYIYIYISHFLPHFFYFIIADLQRESSSLWELCFCHLANLIAFVSVLLLRPSPLKEPSTNFVSHHFFNFILSFTFIFLIDH